MPSIEKSSRRQFAVLWPSPVNGQYDGYGNAVVDEPVQLKVRWEDGKGEGNARSAIVDVDREIAKGSTMWKGKLEDLPTAPDKPTNLMSVAQYGEIPDVKGKRPKRTVKLVLLGSQLPEEA